MIESLFFLQGAVEAVHLKCQYDTEYSIQNERYPDVDENKQSAKDRCGEEEERADQAQYVAGQQPPPTFYRQAGKFARLADADNRVEQHPESEYVQQVLYFTCNSIDNQIYIDF